MQIFIPKTHHFSRKICSIDPTFGNLCGILPPKKNVECSTPRFHLALNRLLAICTAPHIHFFNFWGHKRQSDRSITKCYPKSGGPPQVGKKKVLTSRALTLVTQGSIVVCKCSAWAVLAELQSVLPTPWFTCQIGLLWNRLPRVKKTVGQVALNWATFHLSACGSSFFLQFANFLLIQKVFEPFQCPRTFFSSISGIKMSWRAININYQLHAEVNNLIVFPPKWVILIILWLKNTQIWEIGRMITW